MRRRPYYPKPDSPYQKISNWMIEQKMTVETLGVKINRSSMTVFRYLNGSRNIPVEVLMQLEKISKGALNATEFYAWYYLK